MSTPIINVITKKIKVRLINAELKLPNNLRDKIDNHWQDQIKKGKKYFRGDIYSYANKKESKE